MALQFVVARANAETIAVVYPKLADPEQRIFTLMRNGVRESLIAADAQLAEFPVDEGETRERVAERIQGAGASRILALGRRAYELTGGLERTYPIFVTAVDLVAGEQRDVPGITLVPDPTIVFQTLRSLAPKLTRIILVIDRRRSEWLMRPAQEAARQLSFELVVHDARSLSEGASSMWNALRFGNPETDALWILDSTQFATSDVFPRLVEESWSRHFVLCSNVLDHANQGALFAIYVDPLALGRRAGASVLKTPRGGGDIEFLEDVGRAVNMRAAAHLGLSVSAELREGFDLVLAERVVLGGR